MSYNPYSGEKQSDTQSQWRKTIYTQWRKSARYTQWGKARCTDSDTAALLQSRVSSSSIVELSIQVLQAWNIVIDCIVCELGKMDQFPHNR